MNNAEQDGSAQPASRGSIASRVWRRGYFPAELLAGATAGGLAAFVLLPIDTVKVNWKVVIPGCCSD